MQHQQVLVDEHGNGPVSPTQAAGITCSCRRPGCTQFDEPRAR